MNIGPLYSISSVQVQLLLPVGSLPMTQILFAIHSQASSPEVMGGGGGGELGEL